MFLKKRILILAASIMPAVSFAENYQQVLNCDNGAAVVDVDHSNRKQVQIVIRDQNIIRFLVDKGVSNDRSPRNCQLVNGRFHCQPPSELIFQGRNAIERGSRHDPGNLPGYPFFLDVYEGQDFKSAVESNLRGPRVDFVRDGGGLKVIGYKYIDGFCPGFVSPSTGGCSVLPVPGRYEELANWYFGQCR